MENPALPHAPPKIAAKAAPTAQQGLFVEAASAASARSSPPGGCCDSRFSPSAGCHDSRSSPSAGCRDSRSSPPAGCHDSRSSPSAGCHDNPLIPSLRVPRQQTHPLPPGATTTQSSPPSGRGLRGGVLDRGALAPLWKRNCGVSTLLRKNGCGRTNSVSIPLRGIAVFQQITKERRLSWIVMFPFRCAELRRFNRLASQIMQDPKKFAFPLR